MSTSLTPLSLITEECEEEDGSDVTDMVFRPGITGREERHATKRETHEGVIDFACKTSSTTKNLERQKLLLDQFP